MIAIRFLLRRILRAVGVLIGVSVLAFLLYDFAPGDFFEELRLNPRITPETVQALRHRAGADRPLMLRYLYWLQAVSRGDLGYSLAYNARVTDILLPRARNTLVLTATAIVISWGAAVLFGVWAALHRRGRAARLSEAGVAAMLSTPELLLALIALVFAARTGWFPVGGMLSAATEGMSLGRQATDFASHLALPVMVLVISNLPTLAGHVRAAMEEALQTPYVVAARGLGIRPARLVWVHAFRAAANPLVSLFGVTVGALLSMSLLVEIVLSWPGLGPLVLEAIFARDLAVVLGAMLLSACFMLAGNLAADLALYAMDPRIRVP